MGYLPALLWAYRKTPHAATGEKPSFLFLSVATRSETTSCQ